MGESSASSSSVWKHFEKNKRDVYCSVQTLPEDVEVEREYDKQPLESHQRATRHSTPIDNYARNAK